jgi:glycosidase
VRKKLRDRGMGLILDFVPNHTALDHPWVASHPEFFIEGAEDDFHRDPSRFQLIEQSDGKFRFLAHGRDPYFPSWTDTAQLNHFDSDARQELIGVIQQLAQHADGLRCDMAMLALSDVFARIWQEYAPTAAAAGEFWAEAIAAAPHLIWLAEAYWDMETRLQQLGFQFTYDKRFYDSLLAGSASELRRLLSTDIDCQRHFARFLENHDEQRSATAFGADKLQAAATLTATAPGLRFYFHGQLEGRKVYRPVQLARAVEEPVDGAVHSLYQRLLCLSDDDVFHTGRWSLIEVAPASGPNYQNLIAYQWRSDKSWKLVAANVGDQTADGRATLGAEVSRAPRWLFSDKLNDVDYLRETGELASGLYIRLDPWRAHLFDIRARE